MNSTQSRNGLRHSVKSALVSASRSAGVLRRASSCQQGGPVLTALKTHAALFMSQAPFGIYVVLARAALYHIHPTFLATLRFSFGLFWLWIFHFVTSRRNMFTEFTKLPQKLRRDIALTGYICAHPILFIYGVQFSSANIAAAIECSMPAIAIVLSLLLRTEPLTAASAVGLGLSLAGNFLLLQLWKFHAEGETTAQMTHDSEVIFGALLCFISAFCSVVSTMLQKPLLKVVPPADFCCYALMFAVQPALLVSLYNGSSCLASVQYIAQLWEGHDAPDATGDRSTRMTTLSMVAYAVLLQGWLHPFFSSLATDLSSPVMVAMYSALIPVISGIFAFFLLGEVLAPAQYCGVLLVVMSVVVASWNFDQQRQQTKVEGGFKKTDDEIKKLRDAQEHDASQEELIGDNAPINTDSTRTPNLKTPILNVNERADTSNTMNSKNPNNLWTNSGRFGESGAQISPVQAAIPPLGASPSSSSVFVAKNQSGMSYALTEEQVDEDMTPMTPVRHTVSYTPNASYQVNKGYTSIEYTSDTQRKKSSDGSSVIVQYFNKAQASFKED